MRGTNEILKRLLQKIAAKDGHTDLKKAADSLIHHDWEEIGDRATFYKELGALLRHDPFDLQAVKKSVQSKGGTILGGFGGFRAQVNDFFQQNEAEDLIRSLISDGSEIPDAGRIDSFIREAVSLAFHARGGSPNRSGAAKLASVLLTAVFPDHFVDFVHKHWSWTATKFELGMVLAQKTTNYGERLLWAGQVARQFASTSTFRSYFVTDMPANWVVAGLAYLCATNDELNEMIEEVRRGLPPLPDGDSDMEITTKYVWEVLKNHNPQVILQGPPGSGKTYLAEQVIKSIAGSGDVEACRLAALWNDDAPQLQDCRVLWDIVQFHPSYSYEDFVRGLVTEPTERGIVFRVRNRILAKAAKVARDHHETPVILILDEINRADLARVLGELIYALERERRGLPVSSQYGIGDPPDHTLRLPPNLYLIGTMNTADRSIALVDYAIRRRFSFFSILPRIEAVEAFYEDSSLHGGDEATATQIGPRVVELYRAVYTLFDGLSDADDIRIGHSYFLVKGSRNDKPLSLADWADAIAFRFAFEVVPMLSEYRKERRLRDGQDEIEVDGQGFSLELREQNQTRLAVKDWLAPEQAP